MKLMSIAGALTALLLVAACDDSDDVPGLALTAEECADMGGRQSFDPGDGPPSCRDDEVQIGWVCKGDPRPVEASRCCVPR